MLHGNKKRQASAEILALGRRAEISVFLWLNVLIKTSMIWGNDVNSTRLFQLIIHYKIINIFPEKKNTESNRKINPTATKC